MYTEVGHAGITQTGNLGEGRSVVRAAGGGSSPDEASRRPGASPVPGRSRTAVRIRAIPFIYVGGVVTTGSNPGRTGPAGPWSELTVPLTQTGTPPGWRGLGIWWIRSKASSSEWYVGHPVAPERLTHLEGVVEQPAASLERQTGRLVFLALPADPDAEVETTA